MNVSAIHRSARRSIAPLITMYLLKKPPKGGMPMTENAQNRNATAVTGMVLIRPPICVMSLVCVFCSTMPAQRNSPPLAMPCIRMYSSAPATPISLLTAKPRKMKPIWLTVL